MTRIKFAALFLAAAFVFCLGGCSKAEPGGNSLPDEHDIVLMPNYNEGESEYEYPESGKSSSAEESGEQSGAQSSAQSESGAFSSGHPEEKENEGYDELILVNPTHYIPDDYTVNLVTVQGKYKLDEKALEGLEMWEIFEAVGRKRGFLISGGEIDYDRTANVILDEFRSGKLGPITLEKVRLQQSI